MALIQDFTDEETEENQVQIVEDPFTYHLPKDSYDSIIKQYDTSADYSVLQYMEGSRWCVNYYNQNLSTNDNGSLLDPANPPVLRPTTKIDNFILYVTSSPSEAKYDTLTGEALFYAGNISPYIGDNFVVPLLNKKLGIFQITAVSLMSYVDTKIYSITFEIFLFGDIPEANIFLVNLEASVNRTYVYNSDFLRNRSSVLLTKPETLRKEKAGEALEYISNNWFREFKDHQTNLLMTKKQCKKCIDINLEKFFVKQISASNYHINPITINTTYSPFGGTLDKYTIMDLLVNKKMIKLDDVARNVIALKGTGAVDVDLRGGDLSMLGFDCIIFPYTDDNMLLEIALYTCYSAVTFVEPVNEFTNIQVPDIVNLLSLTKYLFTDNFYNNDRTDISKIELMLLDYIEDKELDLDDLFLLIDSVNKWSLLQKFFYMPFLYLLVNYYYSYSYSFVSE